MKPVQGFVDRISEILAVNQVCTDMPTRIVYRTSHGPESLLHDDPGDFTPAVVVRPKSTEEVAEIVRLANEYETPIVPQGGRTGSYGAEGMHDCIALDFAYMNNILNIDEKAYRIAAQVGIRIKDYNEFLKERGYMGLEDPSLNWSATLGGRVGVSGYNKFENTWGGSAVNIKGIEVVLANGDVLSLGKGSRIPAKNVTGFDFMSMFLGSKGTYGIVTTVTERFIDIPPRKIHGVWAFRSIEDAHNAYMELLSTRYTGVMWRAKTYHKLRLNNLMEVSRGVRLPEDVEMFTDYNIYGEPEIAEPMEEIAIDIMKKNQGFWRDDIPPMSDVTEKEREIGSILVYMGAGSLFGNRVVNGGIGFKLIPLDPIVPHSRLVQAYKAIFEQLMRIEDGESYPGLSGKLFVLDPGSSIPAETGYTKLWIVLCTNWETWDNETRKEFKKWFRDYAEVVWSCGAALTGTHGFIPTDMQAEILKKEVGEKEYTLMKTIKRALDPKNIMNPKIRC